jgi:predicted dehydrogenase
MNNQNQKPTSLVVGMGIGQLYKQVLEELGYIVVTVDSDPNKSADFTNINDAIALHENFITAHICTPNFTHAELAQKLAPYAKIVFVEKPGVANSDVWMTLIHTYKDTRFVMVKNNQWRDNIEELRSLARQSYMIDVKWINDDRVPNPGTWFTTKTLSYGGVSRDLMPHLLSIYMALDPDWKTAKLVRNTAMKVWQLSDLTKTDYGVVNSNGTYDVDDYASMTLSSDTAVWNLTANWRSKTGDEREIVFHLNPKNGVVDHRSTVRIELGLCPESAYKNMIEECVKNLNNQEFWNNQIEQDYYIHERVKNLEIKNTIY